MSRRQYNFVRAAVKLLVEAMAVAVALFWFYGSTGAFAEAPLGSADTTSSAVRRPSPGPVPSLLGGFQQHFYLLNQLPAATVPVRTVMLPQRAPLLLPRSEGSRARLNPITLLGALLRQQETLQQGQSAEKTTRLADAAAELAPAYSAAAALLSNAGLTFAPAAVSPEPEATATIALTRAVEHEIRGADRAWAANSWAGRNTDSPAAAFPVPQQVGAPVDLDLTTHHSLVVDSPVALKRVSITDDSIAQAIVVSPYQVLLQGRAPGEVSLLLWDANSNARAYTVRVQLDPQPLRRELTRLFPAMPLEVSASGDALVVKGTLPNAATAKRVLAVAGGFSKNVINDLNVDDAADPGQVLLQVRFVEIDRSAVAQFGAGLLSTGAGKTVGSIGTGQYGAPTGVVTGPTNAQAQGSSVVAGSKAAFGLSNLLNVFLFRSDANLGLTLQALEQKNLLQILAEPNLVAMDGKEASFLAGGEFPFPVVQGQGAINNVTIQFKPFGVSLHFKPTILPDGTIDLQVEPEVSSLDFSNALTVSGFLIPALSTRRASTELELHNGQSFVIAGLMDNRLTDNVSKIPGLGDIPILGKFFQSRSSNKSRTELMVVVTAHLVHASDKAPKPLTMAQPFLGPLTRPSSGGHR